MYHLVLSVGPCPGPGTGQGVPPPDMKASDATPQEDFLCFASHLTHIVLVFFCC